MNIHYKYKAAPPLKGTPILSNLSTLSLFSQKESDLGIGAATGEALAGPSSYWFFLQESAASSRPILQRSYSSPNDPVSSSSAHQQSWSNPATPTRSSPVPVEKRHHQHVIGDFCHLRFRFMAPDTRCLEKPTNSDCLGIR